MAKKSAIQKLVNADQSFDLSADLADEYARAAGIDPKLFRSESSAANAPSSAKKASGYKVPAKIVKHLVGS